MKAATLVPRGCPAVAVLLLLGTLSACSETAPVAASGGGAGMSQLPGGSGGEAASSAGLGGGGSASTSPSGGGDAGGAAGTAGASGAAGSAGMAGSAGAAGSAPMGPVKHRFISSIALGGPIAIVSAEGVIEFQEDIAGEANDVWVLPSGNIAHAYKTGVREITPAKVVVWDYPAPAGSEIHSVQPLGNGRFLFGEAHDAGLAYLREVDSTGAVKSTVTVQAAETNLTAHQQFREVRKTPAGTYLVTYMGIGNGKARELDAQGAAMREFPCGAFVAIRLPDGNTLIACGDDHRIVEVDAQNQVVWEVAQNDIPGNSLGFAAGLQRLPNGNTVVANWPGHGGDPEQPQMFEIDREKQVVWEVKNPALKMISCFQILDAGSEVEGQILR